MTALPADDEEGAIEVVQLQGGDLVPGNVGVPMSPVILRMLGRIILAKKT